MRSINAQIKDVLTGAKTARQIVREEGVDSYAIKFYSCDFGEGEAFRALQAEEALRVAEEASLKPVAVAVQVSMVKCSCGHTVSATMVMSASMGSACPDCYDRMSD
jgi:hypothetical protein